MDFPTMNAILFAEDLFFYISEIKKIQCNLPYNLSDHRLVLKTYFQPAVGRAIIHSNMVTLIESYAYANDFCYRQYCDTSKEEDAFKLLNNIFEVLAMQNYGLLKVCALTVEVYLHCIEQKNYKRAYETICMFILFLLKQNMRGGHRELINIDRMAEIINKAHERLDNM